MDNRKRIAIYGAVAAVLAVLALWQLLTPNQPELPGDDPLIEIDRLAMSDSPEVDKRLASLVDNDEPTVARAAIRQMGLRHSDDSRRTLEALLDRTDRPDLQRAAAAAYGRHEQAQVSRLETMLRRAEDPRLRRGAAEGLANHAAPDRPETLETLLTALRDDDEQVRRWAITGVHRILYVRYPFDPEKAPGTQNHIIRQIREDFARQAPTK